MKPVLHVTWEYPPFVVGSLSNQLRKTLQPLARAIPVILVVRDGSDGVSELDGMKVYRVGQSIENSPHILAYAHSLNVDLVRGASRAIYESGGVSLVHCHDWISSLAGIYLKENFSLPLVMSVYSTELTRSRTISSLLSMGIFDVERHCFNKADAIIVADDGLKNSLANDYGVSPEKLNLVSATQGTLGLYREVVI
jgi:1,4-alpha-glucan branching enzyme